MGVVDHVIDDSDKMAADADNELTPRQFVSAQAHFPVFRRGELPAERLKVGTVCPIMTAVVWIESAHPAVSSCPLSVRAPVIARVYVTHRAHR
jgi:hypothetical protein